VTLLAVEMLNRTFGGLAAVRDVSLSVKEGAALAVIGPNGAGKTTFFNLLSGVLAPTSGQIKFKGRDVAAFSIDQRARAGIGRTMQITSVFPDFSVEKNVLVATLRHESPWMSYGLSSSHGAAALKRAGEIIDLVGLRAHATRRCGDLAYGDQRLVEIAIALGSRPELLLMDEPTAGLSPRESVAVTAQLRAIHERTGIALVVVEHDMAVVRQLARRVAVFHLGECIIEGNTDEVMRNPLLRDIYLGTKKP
jgi:branched-chain amino acid transport system ATP-binding protein